MCGMRVVALRWPHDSMAAGRLLPDEPYLMQVLRVSCLCVCVVGEGHVCVAQLALCHVHVLQCTDEQ